MPNEVFVERRFTIHNSRPLKKTWHQMEYLIIKITVFNWLCFSLFLSFSGNSYWRTTNWLELMPYIITVLPNVAKSGLSPTLLASCESSIVPHSRLWIFHCSTSTMHECCWKWKFKIRSEITTLIKWLEVDWT